MPTLSPGPIRIQAPVAKSVLARHLQILGRTADARAVSCSIDWAGPVGMPLEDETGVQAACGIMGVHGRRSGRPEPLGVEYAATAAGVLATQGVLAALIAKARGLAVRSVGTSVSQAALLAVSQYLAAATTDDDWAEPEAAGGPPFTAADGVRFEIETLDAEAWRDFWHLLGSNKRAVRAAWRPFQHRFATATCPLPAELAAATARHPFGDIARAGAATGVSVLEVRADTGWSPTTPPWRFTPRPGSAVPLPGLASGLPLEGLVVVESTRRVQGPLAGYILALLGADVIRVEPPGGDPLRGMPPIAGDCSARFLALNAGKRVVQLDLRSAPGRGELLDLVAGADVFVHNWAPGKAGVFGLDADDLAKVRPGLVYAWASGWGSELGPCPPLGTDFLVQAYSGLAAAVRPRDEPAAPSLMTLTDVMGGLVCAEGVLAALLTRCETGRGSRVDSSLLSAAGVIPRSAMRPGWTELDRPLECRDGYLALCRSARDQPRRVAGVLGSPLDRNATCREEPVASWLRQLSAAGLPAVQVCTDLRGLGADPRFERALGRNGYVFPRGLWDFA